MNREEKQSNNDPSVIMSLLLILNNNKDHAWITIPKLVEEINLHFGREIVNKDEIRMNFIPELQQNVNIQVNHGTIVSSTRGIMMTNDIEVIENFIRVETARIKGISIKLKTIKASKKRLQDQKLYYSNYNPRGNGKTNIKSLQTPCGDCGATNWTTKHLSDDGIERGCNLCRMSKEEMKERKIKELMESGVGQYDI